MIDYLKQLKEACQANGITLREAAEMAGINQSTVWRWEHGEAHPSYRAASRVMATLNDRAA